MPAESSPRARIRIAKRVGMVWPVGCVGARRREYSRHTISRRSEHCESGLLFTSGSGTALIRFEFAPLALAAIPPLARAGLAQCFTSADGTVFCRHRRPSLGVEPPGMERGAPARWAIEIPSSLECGAAVTKRWRQQGKLGPEAPGLHLSLEAARAFAWLCPEHKGVFNKRLADAVMGVPGAPADWIEQMRRAGFNHAIVYDADGERLITTLGKLWSDPEQWPMLYLEGRLAVFGWRDPGKAGAKDLFRGWELDPIQLAFSPQNRKAPATRPKGEAESRPWYAAFWQPAPPRPVDREEASLYLLHAEVLRGSAPRRHLTIWEMSQSAAFVAAAGGWFGPSSLLDPYGRLVLFRPRLPRAGQAVGSLPPFDQLALKFQERFRWQRDDTSPALLLLAVRAARRALAVNPADARAHLILGESYLHLVHHTRERAWGKRMSALVELRQA